MTVDLDAELEREPVGAVGVRGGVERRGLLDDLPRQLRVDRDLPAERAQLWQRVRDERADRVDVAVDRDHVVGARARRDRAVGELRELDRTEALEHAARVGPRRAAAAEAPARDLE